MINKLSKGQLLYVIQSKGKCDFPSPYIVCGIECKNCELLGGMNTGINSDFSFPDHKIYSNAIKIWVERYPDDDLFEILL
jgi:hypothetical protein